MIRKDKGTYLFVPFILK